MSLAVGVNSIGHLRNFSGNPKIRNSCKITIFIISFLLVFGARYLSDTLNSSVSIFAPFLPLALYYFAEKWLGRHDASYEENRQTRGAALLSFCVSVWIAALTMYIFSFFFDLRDFYDYILEIFNNSYFIRNVIISFVISIISVSFVGLCYYLSFLHKLKAVTALELAIPIALISNFSLIFISVFLN